MSAKRLLLSDEQIIALYDFGLSQKEIVQQYPVSVSRTRAVLQAAGFDTRGYRALSGNAMRVMKVLTMASFHGHDIDAVCDLSFHALRDVLERNGLVGNHDEGTHRSYQSCISVSHERTEAFLAYAS